MSVAMQPTFKTVAGALGDGEASDVDAIQRAIEYAIANGETLYGTAGVYRCDASILIPSGLSLNMSRSCILHRDYSRAGATGLLQNPDMRTKISNVSIRGGTLRNTHTEGHYGNQVCLHGDDLDLFEMRVEEWNTTSRAFLLAGDRIRMRDPWAVSLGQGGGIRYVGGDQFSCSGAHIECGDDCYNFVPGSPGTLLGDMSITNSQYANCTGRSYSARLFLAAMASRSSDMTASISRCCFIGIRGYAGARAWVMLNLSSTGVIEDIDVIGCSVDVSADLVQGQAVFIHGREGTGGVRDIRHLGVVGHRAPKEALEISGVARNVMFNGFRFDAPRSNHIPIDIKSAEFVTLQNGTVNAGGAGYGAIAGHGGKAPSRVAFERIAFERVVTDAVLVSSGDVTVRDCSTSAP